MPVRTLRDPEPCTLQTDTPQNRYIFGGLSNLAPFSSKGIDRFSLVLSLSIVRSHTEEVNVCIRIRKRLGC